MQRRVKTRLAAYQGNVFVRLVCNYLPTALWFHLALGLISIGVHNAWQPLVTSHRLFVSSNVEHSKKTKNKTQVCFCQREGNSLQRLGNFSNSKAGISGNFVQTESREGVWEWNLEIKARTSRHTSHEGPNYTWRLHCFPQPNKLAINEALVCWASTHQSQAHAVAWCDISQEEAE